MTEKELLEELAISKLQVRFRVGYVTACRIKEFAHSTYLAGRKSVAEEIINDIPESINILPMAGFIKYIELKKHLRVKYLTPRDF